MVSPGQVRAAFKDVSVPWRRVAEGLLKLRLTCAGPSRWPPPRGWAQPRSGRSSAPAPCPSSPAPEQSAERPPPHAPPAAAAPSPSAHTPNTHTRSRSVAAHLAHLRRSEHMFTTGSAAVASFQFTFWTLPLCQPSAGTNMSASFVAARLACDAASAQEGSAAHACKRFQLQNIRKTAAAH